MEHKPRKTITLVLEPFCIQQALNTGACIQQGDLFYFVGYTGLVLATADTGKTERGFRKNVGEWTRRVEITKEEILAVSTACMAIH